MTAFTPNDHWTWDDKNERARVEAAYLDRLHRDYIAHEDSKTDLRAILSYLPSRAERKARFTEVPE